MKILYVSTMGDMMKFFEEHFRMLLEQGHEIELACNDTDMPVPEKIKKFGFKTHQIDFSRNPISLDNIKAKKQLKKVIQNNEYDIVHTHTPNASAITRMVCRPLRKKGLQVFYTAHGFHFFNGAPLKNWFLFYPVEKYLSRYTDLLLTMNNEDYNRAKSKFHAKRVIYVPGIGVDTEKIKNISINKLDKKKEFGLEESDIMILSVGELIPRKNHKVVIEALAKLNNKKIHYLIAGKGKLKNELENLIKNYELEDNVKLIGHRNDVYELCKACDIYVFPSIHEGLPVALMEAICCDNLIVCSDIRGNNDLIKNGENGFLVNNNSDEYVEKINFILNNPDFKEKAIEYNKNIITNIDIKNVNEEMKKVYK